MGDSEEHAGNFVSGGAGVSPAARILAVIVWAGVCSPAFLSSAEVQNDSTIPDDSGLGGTSAVWDPRDRPQAGCPDGCAYLFGGTNGLSDRNSIQRYNPTQKAFEGGVAALPAERYLTSATWDGQSAFVFGGYQQDGGPTDEIVRFHPESNAVTTGAGKLPSARYYTSAVWTGRFAYVFGGTAGGAPALDEAVRYDPLDDSATLADLRLPSRRFGTSAIWDGRVAYIFGGLDGTTYFDTIIRFDPSAGLAGEMDVMTTRLPTARAFTSAAWDGRYAYVYGGADADRRYDQVLRYDPTRDTLVVLHSDALPSPRSETAAASDGTATYVFGGFDGSRYLRDILRIDTPRPAETTTTTLAGTTVARTTTGPVPGQDPGAPWPVWIGAGAVVATTLPLGYVAVRALVRRGRRPVVAARGRPREPGDAPGERLDGKTTPVLAVRELTVTLGKRAVVQSVTFDVPRAHLTFLLGMSGSGKSSLLRALVGLNAYQGDVVIDGVPLRPGRPEAKRLVGYVPQELQLYENLNPLDNIAYFASQYGIPAGRAQALGAALLRELGLQDAAKQRLGRLSGGQRRRISIAAALIHQPPLVILDEPTSGLDFSSRKALWGVLQRLARDRGIAILASTHFIDDTQYASRVGIMFEGRLAALGTPRELIRSLPGGGRCVEIEFEDLGAPDRARLEKLLPTLRAQGLVERAEYHAFSVRYFSKDPAAAARTLPDHLFRQRFAVRATRLDDVNLEDVFVYYTGQNFQEETP